MGKLIINNDNYDILNRLDSIDTRIDDITSNLNYSSSMNLDSSIRFKDDIFDTSNAPIGNTVYRYGNIIQLDLNLSGTMEPVKDYTEFYQLPTEYGIIGQSVINYNTQSGEPMGFRLRNNMISLYNGNGVKISGFICRQSFTFIAKNRNLYV